MSGLSRERSNLRAHSTAGAGRNAGSGCLTMILVWLGVCPTHLLRVIQTAIRSLGRDALVV